MGPANEGLLDRKIVDLVYGDATSEEERAAVRGMLAGVAAALERDAAALGTEVAPAELRARLHRLKGMLGNFGFQACAALLAAWEREPGAAPGPRRDELLATFARSREELVALHPWLR